MYPFPTPSLLAGSSQGAAFVGALAVNMPSSSIAVSFPPGTQAGDIAIIFWAYSGPGTISGGAGGWSISSYHWSAYGYTSTMAIKVLAAGDLAGVTVNDGAGGCTLIVAVYRGATAATPKTSFLGASGSTLTIPGFTKSASCKGILNFVQDRDPGSNPVQPSPLIMRAGPGNFGYFAANVADQLSPASYVSGTDFNWTDFVTATQQIGVSVELT